MKPLSRRAFLRHSTLAASAIAMPGLSAAENAESKKSEAAGPIFSALGVAASPGRAAEVKLAGAQFLTVGVGSLLVPDKAQAEFGKHIAKLKDCPLPVLACNSFIRPRHLRCVGADATHDQVLAWAETTFARAREAGVKFIVFGSSGSRRLKDGWPKKKADAQFTALLKRMGPLAENHGVTVALEPLNDKECNYINHIGEVAAIVRAVGHPKVRGLADLYHLARMGDTPSDLEAAMDTVVHVEIAEKEKRTAPGVAGDDFRPYFHVLKSSGYHGAICIEGRWKPDQLANAFRTIREQERTC